MKNEQVGTLVEPLGRAFASTRAVLVQVQAGQLEAPTPCASWDVRALIEHFIGSARWVAAAIGGEEAADEDRAAVNFIAAYDQAINRALVAFGADGALEKAVTLPWGEFSGVALMWLAVNDQFVHGWDLAGAIGHDTDLDPGLAEELLVRGQDWITDAYRGPDGAGLFGPAVKAPAGVSPADRLAAFLGRSKRVTWEP
jgi:uncharacterized protein (TIGR03086 family)